MEQLTTVHTTRISEAASDTKVDRISFPLHISERKLLLRAGDVAILWIALVSVAVFRLKEGSAIPALFWNHLGWFLILATLWFILANAFNAYDPELASRWLAITWTMLRVVPLTVLIYGLIPYVTPYLLQSRLTWALFAALATAGIVLWRMAYARLITQPNFCQRVLILGAGWAGQTIVDLLRQSSRATYEVVGFVDDDPAKQGRVYKDVNVLGTTADLTELVARYGVHEVILAVTNGLQEASHQCLLDVYQAGIQIVRMLDLYEVLTGQIPVQHCGDQWLTVLPALAKSNRRVTDMVQRACDILSASLLLILTTPLFPVVALLIRLDSPGPIFYRQRRMGHWGRLFWVTKFRSMAQHAESNGAVWATKRDPRVTRLGHFLRKTRIDELPQLWNVLRGEMSLIGPRPERPEFTEDLEKMIPFFRARLMVKPGLTGWAQVNYGYGSSIEDALVKLQYDLYYVKHRGIYLDLLITLRTLGVIISMRGT